MGDRIAVVTRGNHGLGFNTCRALAELGYQVVLAARTVDKARAGRLSTGSRRYGGTTKTGIGALAARAEPTLPAKMRSLVAS